uniref:Palmitoyltransferase n=1 Tax=Trypanosoma congolense (strain IL3000) TaxID=1068625 RepID=G0UK11_TRYCI|nr:conserved hypothetical protein [Trypanosoma congolense IL3000]
MCLLPPKSVGSMRIWRNGAICIGPHFGNAVVSMVLIVIGSSSFIFVNFSQELRVLCGVFGVLSMFLIIRCATRDPGISARLPRAGLEQNASPKGSVGEQVECVNIVRRGREEVRELQRKWCYACNFYRPLRAVHCLQCDVCIQRRDHHCPWVGTCVGQRNYLLYFLFLWSVVVLSLIVLIGGVWGLVLRVEQLCGVGSCNIKDELIVAFRETYFVEPAVVLLSLLVLLPVVPLVLFHTHLALRNMTSGEYQRSSVEKAHYFDRGGLCANLSAALCAPIKPSIFSKEVDVVYSQVAVIDVEEV